MILSAAIVDKDGTIYVARQYSEMTRSKVEALYIAFSRLITKDKQSNILEDIRTLSLFTGAITDFGSLGRGVNEESISKTRFDLLFLFDEIVCMGVRQVDNLTQLRTIIEMKSEEEKAFVNTISKKEREAKLKAAQKSKELDQQRRNEMLHQVERPVGISSSIKGPETVAEPTEEEEKPKPPRVMSRGRALKLKPKK